MTRNKSTSTYLPPLLFCLTLFTSAFLLFWIQPLIGKTLLPLLGGSPGSLEYVSTFFPESAAYRICVCPRVKQMAQPAVASGQCTYSLITLIAIYLFLSSSHSPALTAAQQENPTLWLLKSLLFSVGLPFFILSASNPLLQSWFSRLRHHLAVDPYFLFAASNAGSLIALVAFPLVLEPSLGLSEQHQLWRVGFVVLACLTWVIASNPETRDSSQQNSQQMRKVQQLRATRIAS